MIFVILLFIALGVLLIPLMIFVGWAFANWLFGDIIEHHKKYRRGKKW